MRTIDKTLIFDVAALTQIALQQKKTTTPRFKLPMTHDQAYSLLESFYRAEVAYRNRQFIADEYTRTVLNRISELLTDGSSKFGIILCGSCGNGKTTCLYALQAVIAWLKRESFLPDNHPGLRIISAKEIANLARSNEAQFKTIIKAPMLAIDDMGEEPGEVANYGNVYNPITDLLESRYIDQLPTFITTNLDSKDLREKYRDRIADRLNEMFDRIVFDNNTSYRLN